MTNQSIQIKTHQVGAGFPCFIIAEIGINHNGNVETALRLIDAAVNAGCQAVKFQKRTIDLVYTAEELAKPRENPFGPTNGDLKRGLEFGIEEYLWNEYFCFIEWPDIIQSLLPSNYITIEINLRMDQSRDVVIKEIVNQDK